MLRRHLTLSAAVLAALISLPASSQQKQVWKASDVHPLGYPTVEATGRMARKLEKATNGRISIQMLPSTQLGGEKEMIEQARVGALVIGGASDASSYLTATVIKANAGWTTIDGRYTPPV